MFLTSINGVELEGFGAVSDLRDYYVLGSYAAECRDYVEIGTAFGGSAVIAGLACSGEVHCIDLLPEYAMRYDWPTPDLIRRNWDRFDLDPARMHIHRQRHPPWPDAIDDRQFDMGFIDGNHQFIPVWMDFLGMQARVRKYIAFHDVPEDGYPTASYHVGPTMAFLNAVRWPDWEECHREGEVAVLRRVK